jgi:hypothetical protein
MGSKFALGFKLNEFAESVSNLVLPQNSLNGNFFAVTFREFNGLANYVEFISTIFSLITSFAAIMAFIGFPRDISGSIIGNGVKDFYYR